MKARLLLDTNILLRSVVEPRRLSKDQFRILRDSGRRTEPFAISAMTLLELALLEAAGVLQRGAAEVLSLIETHPGILLLPLTLEICRDAARLKPILRDPADAVIAATARIHGIRLVTSDQRIIGSNVVSTIG
ncbi:MAG: PIN domain-containing protein [Acidobacteriota bacterium]